MDDLTHPFWFWVAGGGRCEKSCAESVFFYLISKSEIFAFFRIFGPILGVFWRPKSMKKWIVATSFSMLFFMRFFIDFLSFFEGCDPRFYRSCRVETLFFAKSTFSKISEKMYEIWSLFGAQIE